MNHVDILTDKPDPFFASGRFSDFFSPCKLLVKPEIKPEVETEKDYCQIKRSINHKFLEILPAFFIQRIFFEDDEGLFMNFGPKKHSD
jgi:hypothetical protein